MTEEFEETEERLWREVPTPATTWRHELLRTLRQRPLPPGRPDHLWILVAVCAAVGCALLLVGALLI